MEKEELKRVLMEDLQTDYTGLGFIISLAGDIAMPAKKIDTKKLVLDVLAELLAGGFIRAGMLEKDGGFCAWDSSSQVIIQKIEREWRELNRDPDINEVAWFSIPENVTSSVHLLLENQ